MSVCPYINQNDVSMRLHNTYCIYKGKPVLVSVNTGFKVGDLTVYENLKTLASGKLIHITDPDFTYVFPEIGYVNDELGAVYLAKRPDRRQKQGLDPASVSAEACDQASTGIRGGVTSLLASQGFLDAVHGKYPTFDEAMSTIKARKIKSVALSKHFAICEMSRGVLGLMYCNKCIAIYNRKQNKFNITDERVPGIILSRLARTGINYE